MPPRSPLPPRHGLGAAWLRTPDRTPSAAWSTMGEWLRHRLPERVDIEGMLVDARFVYDDGRPVAEEHPYEPHTFIWFHRDLVDEITVPGEIHIVHRDDRLIVVDKPAFLSSIPRGRHVCQSVVVRLRDELDLPELSPLHRLDRVTSGLLMLATERRWRGSYQTLFQHNLVTKTYTALAPIREDLELPATVSNHIVKRRGSWQVEVVADAAANAETLIELESVSDGLGVYRLAPRTGRTHQLRKHLNDLGIPIVNDPLYPVVQDIEVDDFARPLQLLAAELSFTDPFDRAARTFTSARGLPL